ncbi:MAG: hypothetical protein ACI807_003535 [Paracoccaceae bacterium]|jgi:hypothetical protein
MPPEGETAGYERPSSHAAWSFAMPGRTSLPNAALSNASSHFSGLIIRQSNPNSIFFFSIVLA